MNHLILTLCHLRTKTKINEQNNKEQPRNSKTNKSVFQLSTSDGTDNKTDHYVECVSSAPSPLTHLCIVPNSQGNILSFQSGSSCFNTVISDFQFLPAGSQSQKLVSPVYTDTIHTFCWDSLQIYKNTRINRCLYRKLQRNR